MESDQMKKCQTKDLVQLEQSVLKIRHAIDLVQILPDLTMKFPH